MVDPPSFSRDADLRHIAERVIDGDCCALVGVSNVGKSHLLRAWRRPEVVRAYLGEAAEGLGFVYIDFNLMLEMSEQGFYELILRTVMTVLRELPTEPQIYDRVNEAYQPSHPKTVPLCWPRPVDIQACSEPSVTSLPEPWSGMSRTGCAPPTTAWCGAARRRCNHPRGMRQALEQSSTRTTRRAPGFLGRQAG